MSTLTSFLDEFLVNVFYPQLEETVTELCSHTFAELDAFQEDHRWSQHSLNPIFKVIHPKKTGSFFLALNVTGHLQFLFIGSIFLQIT